MALQALGGCGHHARCAIPLLAGYLCSEEKTLSVLAAYSLMNVCPEAEPYLPLFKSKGLSTAEQCRWAVEFLEGIDLGSDPPDSLLHLGGFTGAGFLMQMNRADKQVGRLD